VPGLLTLAEYQRAYHAETGIIRSSKLPPKVVTAGGVVLERPEYWR
jgi:hypothetical protein